MKLSACVLLLIAGYAWADNCTTNTDCETRSATICNAGYHVICEHSQEQGVTMNGGLCTCAADDLTCSVRDDCLKTTYKCVSDDHRHCYDGKCICSRW